MKDTDGESLSSSLGRRLSLAHANCFDNTWELYNVEDSPSQKIKKAQRRSQLRSVSFETDPNQSSVNRDEAEQNDIAPAPPHLGREQPAASSSAACGTSFFQIPWWNHESDSRSHGCCLWVKEGMFCSEKVGICWLGLQKRKVIHHKCGLPQDGTSRDIVLGIND